MYIQKIQKPKDAVRIASENDIPEFLRDTIRIEGDKIICLAAEGYNTSPLGSVIGYDKNAPTATGKGAWPLGEHSYVEKDGVFYPAPEIRTAEKIEAPYSIDTKWGKQTLEVGQEGYLVTSPNGDRNILTLGTSSAADYMVCTEQGVNIAPLSEYARLNSGMTRPEEHRAIGRGGLPGSNKIDTERKNPANGETKPGTQNISEDINR